MQEDCPDLNPLEVIYQMVDDMVGDCCQEREQPPYYVLTLDDWEGECARCKKVTGVFYVRTVDHSPVLCRECFFDGGDKPMRTKEEVEEAIDRIENGLRGERERQKQEGITGESPAVLLALLDCLRWTRGEENTTMTRITTPKNQSVTQEEKEERPCEKS